MGCARVEFIDENGGGPAVRLRKRAHVERGAKNQKCFGTAEEFKGAIHRIASYRP